MREPERKMEGEVVIYNPDDTVRIEVQIKDETVWIDRNQMSRLFDRDIKTIGKHIGNAKREELKGLSTVAHFATVQQEGSRWVSRSKEYYYLDMILSVGYRIKSSRGVTFRRWANTVLREYLLRGYTINPRLEHLEQRMTKAEEKIDFFVKTALPAGSGIL